LNLAIDIGNTRIKSALFNQNGLIDIIHHPNTDDILNNTDRLAQCQHIVIGSVVDGHESFYQNLNALKPTLLFTSTTKIPLRNLYQSSATLGSDRLSASIGAYYLCPNTNMLVVDIGTCIKYNFTDSQNNYLGGGISPGIKLRFKALNQFTSKLPLVESDFTFNTLIGTNTQNSILSGVLTGAVAEVDGIITKYKEQYPNLICVLTGGDCEYFAKQLKNSIFVSPNLVLKGLNDILNYNLEHL